ncbi:MAG: redoxin domain-containing protein [Pirellulales bacterium]
MRFFQSTSRFAFAAACCAALILTGCTGGDEQAQGKKGTDAKPAPAKVTKDAKPAASDSAKPADGDASKPNEEKPKVDAPADDKPKDADHPADGDKPAEAAKPAGDAPAADTPSGDQPGTAKSPPAEPPPPVRPDLDVEGQMRLIVDMVNRPRSVRKTPEFVELLVALADGVIASGDSSPGYKSSALLAKFKVLHEAAVDGNADAQTMLVKLADAERENTGRRAAEFVRFVDAEKKLLDAKTLDAAALQKLLEETKAYLADEELSNRHLRMAQLAVDAVERLPAEERDAWYKTLGEQFARSVDLDLAYVGQRFGKPPVPPSALLGKPFELTGTTSSGEKLKWENYRDKIVVVDFWATWCGLCMDQEPRLKDVHAKYASRGLEFVGVSIDANKEDVTRYLRDHEIPWITLFGKEPQEVAAKYGVRGVPTLFLIDAEGKILMRSNSIAELEPHIKTHVEALEKKLAEKRK